MYNQISQATTGINSMTPDAPLSGKFIEWLHGAEAPIVR